MFDPLLSLAAYCASNPWAVAAHIGSNLLTGIAYFSIPLAIAYYLWKRPDLEYRWVAALFVAFITACGAGHFMEAIRFWYWSPAFEWFLLGTHGFTAAISIIAAASLWVLIPKLLRIPTAKQYRQYVANMEQECRLRMEAEKALRSVHGDLERRVVERTRELAKQEERLRMATTMAGLGTWEQNRQGMEWSTRAKAIFGQPPEWTPTPDVVWGMIHPDDRELVQREYREARNPASGQPLDIEHRIILQDGSVRWVAVQGNAMFETVDGHDSVRIIGVMRDTTDQRRWVEQIQTSEARFRHLAESMPQIVFVADATGNILHANRRWTDTTGASWASPEERRSMYHPDDRLPAAVAWAGSRNGGDSFDYELRLWDQIREEYRWHLVRACPQLADDGTTLWYGTMTDIHQQKQNEAALETSLAEKETLLREVHHRVKNNLQSLWALLQLEQANIRDSHARERIKALMDRISIMGNIHRQLYQSSSLAMIDFSTQLDELTQNLVQVSQISETVTVNINAEPLLCDLDVAIPLGLIANEIVTNAVKHAFPDGRAGTLAVTFRRMGDAAVELRIADDGVGSAATPETQHTGIGQTLIVALTEQIRADLTTRSEPGEGTVVTLLLPGNKFFGMERITAEVVEVAA